LGQRPGQRAQELRRARVVLADAPVAVDHEDAVLHVADHDLVDLREVGEVDLALLGDLLAGARVARERGGEAGGREERARRDARLQEFLRPASWRQSWKVCSSSTASAAVAAWK
jgi:hypothetical protein